MKYLPPTGRYIGKLVLSGAEQATLRGVLPFDFPGIQRKAGRTLLPADPRLYELLRLKTGNTGDDSVLEWYAEERKAEQERAVLQEPADVTIPHNNSKILYPYQRVGANFIARVGRSLVCDEPGLGKTAQTITAVEMTVHSSVLIVCPNSLKRHWASEKAKWTQYPTEPVMVISSKNRKELGDCFGWYVINYELFRQTSWCMEQHWDWLVVDEAQNAKNRTTKTFDLLKQLRVKRMALLTGTPFGNNPGELWTLLNLLDPARYSSYWRFYAMYVQYDGTIGSGTIPVGVRNVTLLRRDLLSRMIQRRKTDVYKQLPPKIIRKQELEMDDDQMKHYVKMAKECLLELTSGERLRALLPVSKLLRLRQILSTPACFDLPDTSCKLDAAVDIIQNNPDRLLAMTLFRGTVLALSQRLTKLGVSHDIIMGGMGQEHAAEVQRKLNNGEIKVAICTMQSGGVGLNLVGANTAIIVDKHYNPEKQTQAYDRIHRIGQTKNVYIIELLVPETVDDLVEQILSRKIAMTEAVFARALIDDLEKFLEKHG